MIIQMTDEKIFIPEEGKVYTPEEWAQIIYLTNGMFMSYAGSPSRGLSDKFMVWSNNERMLATLIMEKPILTIRGGAVQEEIPENRVIIVDMDEIEGGWVCPYCREPLSNSFPDPLADCSNCGLTWDDLPEDWVEKIRQIEQKDLKETVVIVKRGGK